jgi:hypothetical protein
MKKSNCQIYAFDPSVSSLPDGSKSMTSCNGRSSIRFQQLGIGSVSETDKKTKFNLKTLADIMAMVKVDGKIDLLKVDVEGIELEL